MLKRIFLVVVIFQFAACAELQQVVNQLPNGGITNNQIVRGLKEALASLLAQACFVQPLVIAAG